MPPASPAPRRRAAAEREISCSRGNSKAGWITRNVRPAMITKRSDRAVGVILQSRSSRRLSMAMNSRGVAPNGVGEQHLQSLVDRLRGQPAAMRSSGVAVRFQEKLPHEAVPLRSRREHRDPTGADLSRSMPVITPLGILAGKGGMRSGLARMSLSHARWQRGTSALAGPSW